MERETCAGCGACQRRQIMAISMLESDPEYPWASFGTGQTVDRGLAVQGVEGAEGRGGLARSGLPAGSLGA